MNRQGRLSTDELDVRRDRTVVAAQACETCRSRKTRCDEGRPSCGACLKLKVECKYEDPRPTKKDKNLVQIAESLQRVEAAIGRVPERIVDLLRQHGQSQSALLSLDSSSLPTPITGARALDHGQRHGSSATFQNIPYRSSNFQYESPVASRKLFSWPTIAEALRGDLDPGSDDFDALREGGPHLVAQIEHEHGLLDTKLESQLVPGTGLTEDSRRRVIFPSITVEMMEYISASYFETFNYSYPILDQDRFYSHTLPTVVREGLGDDDIESVITLLVLALGQYAIEGISGEPLDDDPGKRSGLRGGTARKPPGLELFNEARRRMGFEMCQYTLEHVRAFILAALLFAQLCRHADYWRMATHASTACEALLASTKESLNSSQGDQIRRAYWLCSLMQLGGLLDLDFPLTTLCNLDDSIPLPDFIGEGASGRLLGAPDSHFQYHFLAQITLQQVVRRVYDHVYGPTTISMQIGRAHYEPPSSMVKEMSRQLEEWRQLLPNPLQWNDDQNEEMPNAGSIPSSDDPMFGPGRASATPENGFKMSELLIACLRSRYQYVKYLIHLPYVYKALAAPDHVTEDDIHNCSLCLRACLRWPITMAAPRDQKRLIPHLYGWSTSLLNVLIILHMTTKSPVLQYAREKNFAPGEMEQSAALMLEWIRDMRKIDVVADKAWRILSQLYPV